MRIGHSILALVMAFAGGALSKRWHAARPVANPAEAL
jgi:hypothetical protein